MPGSLNARMSQVTRWVPCNRTFLGCARKAGTVVAHPRIVVAHPGIGIAYPLTVVAHARIVVAHPESLLRILESSLRIEKSSMRILEPSSRMPENWSPIVHSRCSFRNFSVRANRRYGYSSSVFALAKRARKLDATSSVQIVDENGVHPGSSIATTFFRVP